ncbi:5-formyltetrahydrofolate cyclo-ligase [Rhodoblastus acidophilus]|uniref:5-formyltetrahydrofolate cyclo-ligase n=1 Tax=Candidatus Rhodoblastus alkanivorans TaxID=2954117 RepID=A0ABS9ZAB0_9HYPH|nr:5-formyltetrahydrofolate cyclo-ligase [Candidatus Rhodoblastus alkanivorans]MCI4677872.1 5-formyltetrahydrofolate cyclo-ligase [Candidatus Rhodoblastus alkanivorans]MCI4684629.1 5-formyltetrahydrofolate cyclo-ligase [Candidatus Rhodoblastus alkanivorans]MDI4641951.1 5-formyltetrahydrofolate cyclo-ligase [Rhodoblastus acidophilus]
MNQGPVTPSLAPHSPSNDGRSGTPHAGGGAEKARLREKLRAARAAIPASQAAAAAERIAARAFALVLEQGGAPAPVALYAAMPGELDCLPLLAALAGAGFPTLLPVAGARATPLIFRLWRPGDPLVAARFGLREPPDSAPEMRPAILFAPLLGFDDKGTRLGFGGGYYDATLAHLRASGPVVAGGLAFSCQRADEIPRESHDQKLDFVVTEADMICFA